MSVDSLRNLYLNTNLDVWKSSKDNDNLLTYKGDSSCNFKCNKQENQCHLDLKTQLIDESVTTGLAQLRGITLQAERSDNGSKLLVNIVANDRIGKPSFSCEKRKSKSFQWTIPHLICEPRLDFNLSNLKECDHLNASRPKDGIWVYDVIVNPVCIAISKENANLKSNLVHTAIHGIEQKFKINLITKLPLGLDLDTNTTSPVSSIKIDGKGPENEPMSNQKKDSDVLLDISNKQFQSNDCLLDNPKLAHGELDFLHHELVVADNNDHGIIPEYKIKYVNHSTLQDYSIYDRYILNVKKPDILALEIKLMGVSKASDINAKVVFKEFILRTINECNYFLKLTLPHEVEEEPVKAKFDIVTGLLSLEFAVKRQIIKCDISPTFSTDSGIECESEYRTSSDGDNSSISSQEECDNQTSASSDKSETKDKLNSGLCNNVQEYTEKFILSPLTITQNAKLLFVTIACPNIVKNSVKLTSQNPDCFSFKYITFGGGFASICYGAIVYVQPYCFKQDSLTWTTEEDDLLIQVEKSQPDIWKEVYVGLNLNNLSACNVTDTNNFDNLTQKLHSNSESVDDSKADKINGNDSETKNVDIPKTSEGVKISRSRCTSDCFVTGSWPKGILKGRSRSLSDSQVDSSWVFGSFTELEDEVLEEDEDEAYNQSGNESPTTKKSVHFNDFISKQVFKSDSSILGQRAKNQKKALQKKRSRERKLSEGNSSAQSQSEQSDAAATTTEDESNTEGEATDSQRIYSKSDKTNRKIKNKKGKSKKGRKVPNLSNDLIFQLDES